VSCGLRSGLLKVQRLFLCRDFTDNNLTRFAFFFAFFAPLPLLTSLICLNSGHIIISMVEKSKCLSATDYRLLIFLILLLLLITASPGKSAEKTSLRRKFSAALLWCCF
jgi:hypothetical protein